MVELKNVKDYFVNLLITIIIAAVIFSFIDLEKTIEVIKQANLLLLAIALFFYILVVSTMAIRIRMILDYMGHKTKFVDSLRANLSGMIASDFTPARSGYFLTAFLLTDSHRIKFDNSLLTIFGPQLFEFTIKATCAAIMSVIVLNKIGGAQENALLTAISIIGVFFVIFFFGAMVFVKGFLGKISFVCKISIGKKIYALFDMMQKKSHYLLNIKFKIIGITLLSAALKGIEWFFISKALGIDIFGNDLQNYLFIMVLQASTTLLQFLPLPTLAGGGASELGVSTILLLFGVPLETGIAFALLTRAMMIAIDIFGTPHLISYIRKEGINKIFREIDSIGHF